MNTEQMEKKIEELEMKIKGLENDLDVLYQTDNRKLARAIHEIQEHLRKEGLYIVNDIYAPTKVGIE